MTREEFPARIKLAGRILRQMRCGGGQPVLQSEIARLRFLAESAAEFEMPIDQLAEAVLERECRRMGLPSPSGGVWPSGTN